MFSLELGRTYRFTLVSGKTVDLIVIGSQPSSSSGTSFTVSIDGVQGTYSSLNDAIGEPFTNCTAVLENKNRKLGEESE